MTKPMNIKSIEKATGKTWDEWLQFFDSIGATNLTHHEIALKVYGYMEKHPSGLSMSGKRHGGQTPMGWWSQNVTVAYEQHIGRRAPGQRSDGKYEVTVSKTLNGTMDDSLSWWTAKVKDMTKFSDTAMVEPPEISKTEKWRYWRANLVDGSKVGVTITAKSPTKAIFSVTSHKLANPKDAEVWRAYWKQFLA